MMEHSGAPRSITPWILVVTALSFLAVLTAYGWLSALSLVIPMATAVLWIGILLVAAWGAGEPVARRFAPSSDDPLEGLFFALVSGFGVLMATTAVLALTQLLRPTTVLTALAVWACLGALRLYRGHPETGPIGPPSLHPLSLVLLAAGGLSLAAATTFAPFYDQWHYHLAFPEQWLNAGTTVVFDRHAYSFFPSNMGLLYVYALAGAGGWAAQVIHWLMGVLAATGAGLLAGRLGATREGRLLAAAVFLATPSVIQMGALAGSDLGVAVFGVAAVLALLPREAGQALTPRQTLIIGALAGLAVGCKILALATVAVPLAVVVGVVAAREARGGGRWRSMITAGLAFGLGLALTSGPWLLRNTVATGNPTHPYLASVFDPASTESTTTAGIGAFGLGPEKAEAALTLGTFARRGHSGDIGPVFLSLAPLVLLWGWRRRRQAGVATIIALIAGGVLVWAAGPPLGRYLVPTLVLLAGTIGVAWTDLLDGIGKIPGAICTAVLVVVLAANCNPTRGEFMPDQLACFAGAASYDEILEENCTQLEAYRAANEELPEDAVLLLVGEPRVLGLERAFLVEDAFRKPLLVELAEDASSPAEIASRLDELGVTHLLVNHAEGARIAKTQGRARFLETGDAANDALLRGFFSGHTRPILTGGWWEISVLEPPS